MHRIYIQRPYHKPDFDIATDDDRLYKSLVAAYGPFIAQKGSMENTECLGNSESLENTENLKKTKSLENVEGLKKTEILKNAGNLRNTANATVKIRFYLIQGKYIFECDGTIKEIPYDYALQAIENIIYETTAIDDEMLAVHAGAVGIDGRAFILAGFTESGKSTLTAYLYNQGYEYISDDIVLIKKKDLSVVPFRRPLQLRQGGADVLRRYNVRLDGCDFIDFGNIKRIVMPVKPLLYDEYSIGGILFIRRTENINSLLPIPKQKAFTNLMKNQFVFMKPEPELLGIIKALCEKGVYELLYSDMKYVGDVLKGIAYE